MMFVTLSSLAYASFHRARELELREVARSQLAEFRRHADEAMFLAANSDPLTEQAPYYDPQRALALGDLALTQARIWGDDASRLPLVDERPALKSELHELLLFVASLHQRLNGADRQLAALELVKRAELLQPPSRASLRIRARCLQQLGRVDEANQAAQMAKSAAAELTALDWFLEGEWQRGESSAQRDPLRPPGSLDVSATGRAIDSYRQALRIDPQHYWAQFQLARCYLRMQRGPEAVEALGACIALRPDTPWAYSTRGLVHGMLGQFESAETDLNWALRLVPDFRPAHLNRGFIWSLQGRDDEALAELDAALQPPAEDALIEASYYRAQIHSRRGDLEAALRDCETFLRQRPRFRPALVLQAQLHFRQGDDAAGTRSVDALLTHDRKTVIDRTGAAARLARGRLLRQLAGGLVGTSQQRVLRLALQELDGADIPEAASEITAIKDLLGMTEEAIARYTERLAISPHDVDTRVLRGWCYARLQRYRLADADFQAAIAQAPLDAEAHAGWGYVQARTGKLSDAELAAVRASLLGAQDFLVLNSVACIYGELAGAGTARTAEYEDLALTFLERAAVLARPHGGLFDQTDFLRNEPSFHASLRARPEFQRLLESF